LLTTASIERELSTAQGRGIRTMSDCLSLATNVSDHGARPWHQKKVRLSLLSDQRE